MLMYTETMFTIYKQKNKEQQNECVNGEERRYTVYTKFSRILESCHHTDRTREKESTVRDHQPG